VSAPTTRAERAARAAQVAAEGRQRECLACGGKGHRAEGPHCPLNVSAAPSAPALLTVTRTGDLRRDVTTDMLAGCRRYGIATQQGATNYAWGFLRMATKRPGIYSGQQLALLVEGLQDGIEIIRVNGIKEPQ
jgi:hypothetical protein